MRAAAAALAALGLLLSIFTAQAARLSEEERVKQWHAKEHNWPPDWQPETDAMKEHLRKREIEIMTMSGANERWENWLQFTQNRLVPKFTKNGFEVIETPEPFRSMLYNAVKGPLENFEAIRDEGNIDVIYTQDGKDAKFVDLASLAYEVMDGLKPYHEAWSGMELVPRSAYGVRFYQNGSTLVMHYDRVQTHVISSIVHIAHQYDDDNEPWPIQIEDHDGNLHEVALKEGQMLFYESAKCLHGRMKKLKGKYYGSIFIHYQPKDKSLWNFVHDDVINHVPPHWRDDVRDNEGERWAGAAITADSVAVENAPPRTKPISNPHLLELMDQNGANAEL